MLTSCKLAQQRALGLRDGETDGAGTQNVCVEPAIPVLHLEPRECAVVVAVHLRAVVAGSDEVSHQTSERDEAAAPERHDGSVKPRVAVWQAPRMTYV